MTSTTRPSIPSSARSSRTYAWLFVLATGPGLVAVSCSDDAEPDPAGTAGSANTGNAGSGGSSAGSSGMAGGAGGTGGAGASAGADNNAGSAGMGLPSGGSSGGSADSPDASTGAVFALTSPAFAAVEGCGPDQDDAELCDLFPDETTDFAGDNVSPQLDWSGAPEGTQSFAIALHDLSFTQGGDPFTHWVMWNIPASATGLAAALPDTTTPGAPAPEGSQQVSIGDDNGFFGSGAAGNVYEFVLYALSTPSIAPDSEDPDAVEEFIVDLDDVLGTTTLRARSTPDGD